MMINYCYCYKLKIFLSKNYFRWNQSMKRIILITDHIKYSWNDRQSRTPLNDKVPKNHHYPPIFYFLGFLEYEFSKMPYTQTIINAFNASPDVQPNKNRLWQQDITRYRSGLWRISKSNFLHMKTVFRHVHYIYSSSLAILCCLLFSKTVNVSTDFLMGYEMHIYM